MRDPNAALDRLEAVVARLRAPDGCPWDREQTHQTLTRYLLEECFEAADALQRGDDRAACDELGDVLWNVVLHAQSQALAKTIALARWHVASRTPFGVSSGHTFCSKLVAELLRDGGIVPPHALPQATVISPSALHEHLVRFRDTPLLRDPHAVVSAPTPPVDFAPQRCAPQLRLTGP